MGLWQDSDPAITSVAGESLFAKAFVAGYNPAATNFHTLFKVKNS